MKPESDEAIIVLLTAADRDEAVRLAEMLVDEHLAACVQVLPQMNSVFRGQGKVEWQREVLLIAKTMSSKFAKLESEVRALHSYETPEIVALPLAAGSTPYLEWLRANVTMSDSDR